MPTRPPSPVFLPGRVRLALAVVVGTVLMSAPALAGDVNVNRNGIAIRGYDPVAYFELGMPKRGSKKFMSEYEGAKYRFASAEHKALFDGNPAKYAPAYGGFCAYGVAQGVKVKIQPDKFKIVDGTLYLNLDTGIQETWQKDIPGNIAKADTHWPQIEDRLPSQL